MQLSKVTDHYVVGGQISVADLTTLKALGFKTIVCIRHDHEEPGQPDFAEIAARARQLRLRICHLPVIRGRISDENITSFRTLFAAVQHPVYAYCSTGSCCVALWAYSQVAALGVETVLRSAAGAGYDLTALIPRLSKLARL